MEKTTWSWEPTKRAKALLFIGGFIVWQAILWTGLLLQNYAIDQGPDGPLWADLGAYLTLILAGALAPVILFLGLGSQFTYIRTTVDDSSEEGDADGIRA